MAKDTNNPAASQKGPAPSIVESFGLNRYHFTAPKILLIVAALAMIIVGLYGSSGQDNTKNASRTTQSTGQRTLSPSGTSSLVQPFVEAFPSNTPSTQAATSSTEERTMLEQWSPSLVRGGFTMFLGFAIGYAIRAFLRLATVIVGAYFLVLTLMAWAGWVEIHWEVIEGQFDQMVTSLETQFASFKAFLMGSIPSAGLGAAGLASGLRQK